MKINNICLYYISLAIYLPRNISPRLANPHIGAEEIPHTTAKEIIIRVLLSAKFLWIKKPSNENIKK
jgi:hypothetical protein